MLLEWDLRHISEQQLKRGKTCAYIHRGVDGEGGLRKLGMPGKRFQGADLTQDCQQCPVASFDEAIAFGPLSSGVVELDIVQTHEPLELCRFESRSMIREAMVWGAIIVECSMQMLYNIPCGCGRHCSRGNKASYKVYDIQDVAVRFTARHGHMIYGDDGERDVRRWHPAEETNVAGSRAIVLLAGLTR